MAGLFEIANEIAVGFGGRNPEWKTQVSGTDAAMSAPSSATDGVALQNAVVTLLGVALDTATAVDFTVWFYSNGTWYAAEGGDYAGVETNWIERAETGGMDRVYVQITATDGDVRAIAVGPCLKE